MKKLNYREEEAKQYNLTEKESIILSAFVGELYAEENFSDVSPQDLQKITGISQRSYKGVLGSLAKKGVLYIEDKKELGTDMDIVYLSNTDLHPDWYQARNPKTEKTSNAATKLTSLLKSTEISPIAKALKTSAEKSIIAHLKLADIIVPAYAQFKAEKKAKLHKLGAGDFRDRVAELTGTTFSETKFSTYAVAHKHILNGFDADLFIEYVNGEHPKHVDVDTSFKGYRAWAECETVEVTKELFPDEYASEDESGEGDGETKGQKAKALFSFAAKSDEDSGTENGIKRGVSIRVLADGTIETTSNKEEVLDVLSKLRKALNTAEANAKFELNAEETLGKNVELENVKVGK